MRFRHRRKKFRETLKALREGLPPKALTGLASAELNGRVTRELEVNARLAQFLGMGGR